MKQAENTPLQRTRRVLRGRVMSDKNTQSIVVLVARPQSHSMYGKASLNQSRYLAHDQKEEANVGDLVEICESRPLSRRKRWVLQRIITKGTLPLHDETENPLEGTLP